MNVRNQDPSGSKRNLAAGMVVLAFVVPGMLGCGSSAHSSQVQTQALETSLTRLSTDTFTNPGSQHATEVEPAAYAVGSTIVSTFQVGRIFGGGGSDIGFAISSDGGATWTNGFLPGLTIFQGGTFSAASDPSVVFDAAHKVWIISSLLIGTTAHVAVSTSADGIHWGTPVMVSATTDADKNWITCDNAPSSPFFGHCYVEWDDPGNQALIWMSTSTDGGVTWKAGLNTADHASGIGGQPVVQANGNVVVPIEGVFGSMLAFTSTDGGTSWNASLAIAPIIDHLVAGNLRTEALPSAAIDGSGKAYVAWQDCRFRTNCASNDIVLSTSTDGSTWTTPTQVPIDAVTSWEDHFIPGLSVDPATTGSSAHVALTYYFYPSASCTSITCQLEVGFVSSQDGGHTWSAPSILAGPMSLSWLPNTFSGVMVGDYIATAYSGGEAHPVFAVARANSSTGFAEAIYSTKNGMIATNAARGLRTASAKPVPAARPDHSPRQFYDLEHRYPIPPSRN